MSKAYAAYQFYQVDPYAGKLLAITLTLISAAVALQTRTWQLNPIKEVEKKGKRNIKKGTTTTPRRLEPLIPMRNSQESSITKFKWEQ